MPRNKAEAFGKAGFVDTYGKCLRVFTDGSTAQTSSAEAFFFSPLCGAVSCLRWRDGLF